MTGGTIDPSPVIIPNACRIEALAQAEQIKIEGFFRDGLGVVRAVVEIQAQPDSPCLFLDAWMIVVRRTGERLPGLFRSFEIAWSAAAAIAQLRDWASYDPAPDPECDSLTRLVESYAELYGQTTLSAFMLAGPVRFFAECPATPVRRLQIVS